MNLSLTLPPSPLSLVILILHSGGESCFILLNLLYVSFPNHSHRLATRPWFTVLGGQGHSVPLTPPLQQWEISWSPWQETRVSVHTCSTTSGLRLSPCGQRIREGGAQGWAIGTLALVSALGCCSGSILPGNKDQYHLTSQPHLSGLSAWFYRRRKLRQRQVELAGDIRVSIALPMGRSPAIL